MTVLLEKNYTVVIFGLESFDTVAIIYNCIIVQCIITYSTSDKLLWLSY